MEVQEIEILKFTVKGKKKSIFVDALVIRTICSTLTNQVSNSVLLNKHPYLMESLLNIGVLIGQDNYYNLIYCIVIRGKSNDPIALESKLGWIISGPYSIDSETNVYNIDSHFLFVPPTRM